MTNADKQYNELEKEAQYFGMDGDLTVVSQEVKKGVAWKMIVDKWIEDVGEEDVNDWLSNLTQDNMFVMYLRDGSKEEIEKKGEEFETLLTREKNNRPCWVLSIN